MIRATMLSALGAVLLVSACDRRAPDAPTPPPAANRPAPEKPPALAVTDPEEKARLLFVTTCVKCHLETGKGDSHFSEIGIPDFTDPKWHARKLDAKLVETIQNGKGKFMPAWKGKLADEEIAALVRYVRGFPKRAGRG